VREGEIPRPGTEGCTRDRPAADSRPDRDPALQQRLARVADELRAQPTLAALRRSAGWARDGAWLETLLATVSAGVPQGRPLPSTSSAGAAETDPRLARAGTGRPSARKRFVHWNIYKGIADEAILARLRDDPALRDADLISLNEVDVGMARSGNRHVAADLADALGLYWTFAPNYLELTKGPDDDARAPGANAVGLHGVAILSRERPATCAAIPLPACFDMFAFAEKRYGRRTALAVALPDGTRFVTAHLEVRAQPACRGLQMSHLLRALQARWPRPPARSAPYVLAGDWNTHTFHRGTPAHAVRGLARILSRSAAGLQRELMEPWRAGREPLFAALAAAGFGWEACNDREPTASELLGRVEEQELLPPAMRRAALRLLRLANRRVPLRLDWFAAADPSSSGESGWRVACARTVGPLPAGRRPSDHRPLVLDLVRTGEAAAVASG